MLVLFICAKGAFSAMVLQTMEMLRRGVNLERVGGCCEEALSSVMKIYLKGIRKTLWGDFPRRLETS